ncbi:MAG: gamma carbonic anhydrase family protein [Minwuiales bacterium]|nr:gamma carbonic anhydrase family protein [Minwuiales bacterium]
MNDATPTSRPAAGLHPFKGKWPTVAPDAFIAPGAHIIGDVEIGAGSSVWFNCVLRGDVERIRVGARSNIQDGTVVHVTHDLYPTVIGDDVLVGHLAMIHGCTLESGCMIGMKAMVMDAVVVETGAMVAAGALVTPGKRVLSGQLWAGSPAKHVRDLSDEERANLTDGAKHYANLAQIYRGGS